MPRVFAGFYIHHRACHRAGGDHLEAYEMSGWEGLMITLITLGSCWACYWAGQRNMFIRMRDQQERRKRWAEWEDFDQ